MTPSEPAKTPEQPDAVESAPSSEGPVIGLSKGWRIGLAIGTLGIAITRAAWPAFPIDALGLGLIALTILLLFFNIERVEFAGISASRQKARLAKAVREIATVDVPDEAPELPPAPEPVATDRETVVRGHGGLIHRQPFDLNPPTDSAERLLWATEKIRIELVVLAGNSGHLPQSVRWDEYDGPSLARHLVKRTLIPPAFAEITAVAFDARGALLRGELRGESLSFADTLAIDLLQKLREIKRNYVRVRERDVDIYRDQSLSSQILETGCVMLAILDDRGQIQHIHVFPRILSYTKGRFTSWEWNVDRVFREQAWYRDPQTGKAKSAFSEAATFAGREYPEQWGLEYNLPRPDAGLD